MADIFDSIYGQPLVREYLRATISNGHLGHAYLFTGQSGSNKTQAAYALASAILCKNNGCSSCETCQKIARRKHPDVHYFMPEGATGYVVDQVREILEDATLAPIQSDYKIYIIDRLDLMGAKPANAFLKTLEEPPDDVIFILLARTRESVLSTIVSRCQVVPFRHIPAQEAASILVQNSGATLEQAKMAIEASGGSVTRGLEFLKSNERWVFRTHVLESIGRLSTCDDWDVVNMASQLVIESKAPLDSVRAELEEEIAKNADFLGKSAIRRLEARNKRAITAKTMQYLHQMIALMSSYLRDLLMVRAGMSDLVINKDVRHLLEHDAMRTDEACIARALSLPSTCINAISCNVSPETCVDALLFEIREALYGSSRTH